MTNDKELIQKEENTNTSHLVSEEVQASVKNDDAQASVENAATPLTSESDERAPFGEELVENEAEQAQNNENLMNEAMDEPMEAPIDAIVEKPKEKIERLEMSQVSQNSSDTTDKEEESEQKSTKEPKKKKSFFFTFIKFISWLIFVTIVVVGAGVYGFITYISKDLPSITKVADFRPPQTTVILARDGSLIGEIYNEKRYMLSLSDLPAYVPQAFVSAEDKTFFEHQGINPIAIARAAMANFSSGTASQGGSTITQQVVKRLLLTPERTYTRKIKEALLSFKLERQLSKMDILTIYLNQIHMGGMSYGIEAGARYYFNKHAKDLTIAESALLAGILPATTRYNPYRNPEMARSRQVYVLGRMREDGKITDAEYEEAYYQPMVFESMPDRAEGVSGWYLEEVRRQLVALFQEDSAKALGLDYGIYGEQAVMELGLTVHTAMDPVLQQMAEDALRKGLENASKRHGFSGPVEVIESTSFDSYLAEKDFELKDLENNAWVLALVTDVEKKGAQVQLGNGYSGYISVDTMGWARKPNKKVTGYDDSKNVTDATKVLKAGDVVFTRFNPSAQSIKEREEAEAKKLEENFTEAQVPENEIENDAMHTGNLLLGEYTVEQAIPLALEQKPRVQGALVSIEPQSSDVVAMVGGYAFGLEESHFNRATQAKRQPGSAFKPIVYSAALDQGFTLVSQVLDAPILYIDPWTKEVWRPSNFDPDFDGQMTLMTALARSRNLSTVRVAQEIGIESVLQRARDLGLDGRMEPALAASLGAIEVTPMDMAQAYTAFANVGKVSQPRFITSIQGTYGNTIYTNENTHIQGISPQNGYLMSAMLEQVVIRGTATPLKALDRPQGGKTGTTNDEMDAWFVGITPNLVSATYIGYDLPESMGRGETGSRAALPIYKMYAEKAFELYPPDFFEIPEGIEMFEYDGTYVPFVLGTSPYTSVNALDSEGNGVTEGEDLLKQLF